MVSDSWNHQETRARYFHPHAKRKLTNLKIAFLIPGMSQSNTINLIKKSLKTSYEAEWIFYLCLAHLIEISPQIKHNRLAHFDLQEWISTEFVDPKTQSELGIPHQSQDKSMFFGFIPNHVAESWIDFRSCMRVVLQIWNSDVCRKMGSYFTTCIYPDMMSIC